MHTIDFNNNEDFAKFLLKHVGPDATVFKYAVQESKYSRYDRDDEEGKVNTWAFGAVVVDKASDTKYFAARGVQVESPLSGQNFGWSWLLRKGQRHAYLKFDKSKTKVISLLKSCGVPIEELKPFAAIKLRNFEEMVDNTPIEKVEGENEVLSDVALKRVATAERVYTFHGKNLESVDKTVTVVVRRDPTESYQTKLQFVIRINMEAEWSAAEEKLAKALPSGMTVYAATPSLKSS